MTNKEAIEILAENKPTTDPRQCGIELCEAVDVAIKALKTKIPAKVVIEDWAPAYCPTCGEELSTDLGDGYYRHRTFLEVCPNPECCQRLDWGDEE